MIELDRALFLKLRDLVYDLTGMHFEERKKYFFVRRLESRLEATGRASLEDYIRWLGTSSGGAELHKLAEALTTNETYFFREYPQLQAFADHVLPEVLERKRRLGDYFIRLWSAGCSTGEEPYTLAIILREMIEDLDRWQIFITGTDISAAVLRTAERATYGERSLRDVPTPYRQTYFRPEGENQRVVPAITRMVRFQQSNLTDPAVARSMSGQDFIFCRNVLIYFDERSSRQVIEGFYNALSPGGFIFLGHSESVGRITSAFKLVRRGEALVYTK